MRATTKGRNPRSAVQPGETLLREVDHRLRHRYGLSRLGNKDDPLDELIFIILSAKTQESTYTAAFDALKARFSSWDDASHASSEEIEAVIRFAGLSIKKSRALAGLLSAVVSRVASADLTFLRGEDDLAAYRFLRDLPGVGPKSARCVLSYSLGRAAFAVDAHVSRIVRRLGWSSHHRLTERVQDDIQALVPPEIRLSLHVNLVNLGRSVCTERSPACQLCVLADLCPSAFRVGAGGLHAT